MFCEHRNTKLNHFNSILKDTNFSTLQDGSLRCTPLQEDFQWEVERETPFEK